MARTRIAPSPTGLMHLGTARTAYFNWLTAKATKGPFILRIDDTDTERNKPEYVEIIFDSLKWLGLEPDHIYYQSKRFNLYRGEADSLQRRGRAIAVENGALALLLPETMPQIFNDTIGGNIPITDTNRDQIHHKLILLRGKDKDYTPTYQFASLVDDYLMNVNWIIRGTDHISNTPKQIAIWCALNEVYGDLNTIKELPKFTHIGLIFKSQWVCKDPACENSKLEVIGEKQQCKDCLKIVKKLSKRDSAASLLDYRDKGYPPEAILNFILLMGWGISDKIHKSEFINKELAINLFLQGRMKSSPAVFDINKLNILANHYTK